MKKSWNKKKETPPALVEVTLAKNHTHMGEPLKKGSRIKVSVSKIAWLKDQNIIEKQST